GQLSKATQQNASASEQLAATSEELSTQAEQLQQSVAFFRTGSSIAPTRPLAAALAHRPTATERRSAPARVSGANFKPY
ncbi:MAG: methyl-accepting chemotaxis protein, partial [Rhodoferax sp.]